MDPEPSFDVRNLFPTPSPVDFERILNPANPAPADTLLPAVLLGVAAALFMCQDVAQHRLGIGQNATRFGVVMVLAGAISVAGIRSRPSDEVGLTVDLVGAYGIPAVIALLVGLVIGGLIHDRWGPPEPAAPSSSSGDE